MPILIDYTIVEHLTVDKKEENHLIRDQSAFNNIDINEILDAINWSFMILS